MTKWHAYAFKLEGAFSDAGPYYCQATCIDPGHPRQAMGQGKTPEEARANLLADIKRLLEQSEIIEIN